GKPTCSAYYFFMVVVIIRYETTAAARWALLFIVRTFFNDAFTVAVWTSFHTCLMWMTENPSSQGNAGGPGLEARLAVHAHPRAAIGARPCGRHRPRSSRRRRGQSPA